MQAGTKGSSATGTGTLIAAGCVALAYFLTGRFGLELYIAEGTATLVWAPTGIAIASILAFGWRIALPGILAGALFVTLSIGLPWAAAISITMGNGAEALLAYLLLRRAVHRENPFATVRGTLLFISLACFTAPLASAFVGATTTVLAGIRPPEVYAGLWLLWWLGNVAGALLLAPVLYLLGRRWLERRQPDRHLLWAMSGRHAEFLLTLLLAATASTLVYGGLMPERISNHLSWLPFLFLLWGARRFSPLATVAVSLAVSVSAIGSVLAANTLRDADAVNEHLINLYIFLFAQAIATLIASAFIHERRRLTRELVRTRAQAQFASEQKSRFLANMSHEIRTPLNGIIGMTTLLADEVTDPAQKEKLRIIQSSADGLLTILNDVLDLARIEAGKLTLVYRPFDLHRLVNDITGLFSSQAGLKGITLFAIIDDDVPERITSDDTRLRQILANLLSNAVKFTESGGIELHVSLAGDQDNATSLVFSVTDTGTGIDEATLRQIFDPFVQADDSASRRNGGTGLGLTISQQLTEKLGGFISLASTPGKGTCATVRIPFSPAIPAATHETGIWQEHGTDVVRETLSPSPSAQAAANDEARTARILVAEDNDINVRVITRMLERLGYPCEVAGNGEEVLARWRDGFDLILMDCQMPLRDGYQATEEIRRQEKTLGGHIPIIALTANAMREERARCLAAGMDDYLAKPLRLDSLRELLARHPGRRNRTFE
ncbi:MAG: MASE1 domain-containing protein [Gammaproteobacteria bacterium]